MARTDEDKILQSGAVVLFGGKQYIVKPLPIRRSSEWRKSVVTLMASMARHSQVNSDDVSEFEVSLTSLLVEMPETICNLFFAYASGLPREKIEEIATDAEMAAAFSVVMEMAFPLARALPVAMSQLNK